MRLLKFGFAKRNYEKHAVNQPTGEEIKIDTPFFKNIIKNLQWNNLFAVFTLRKIAHDSM